MYGTEQLHPLLLWMIRHGRHVRRVLLYLRGDSSLCEFDPALSGCLTACAASRQLESLDVLSEMSDHSLHVSAWAQLLTRLQRLVMSSVDGSLEVAASLHLLTALRKLKLVGTGDSGVFLQQHVRMPQQLEELEIGDRASGELPEQASRDRWEGRWA